MRRHLIVGRFGASDRVFVPVVAGETATKLQFVAARKRFDHGIGDALDDLAKLGVYPTELGFDLLVVAAQVHAADTRISRNSESQDNWTREIRLVVPVSDVVRWTGASGVLQELLNFLTGDRWTINFRVRPHGFETAVQNKPPQLIEAPFDDLALFSGGLDSLIGAIDSLERARTPLLISHAAEGATSDSQNSVFRELRNHYSERPFDRLRIWMNFPDGLVKNVDSEKTTRGRSFLFFALGVFAGTGLNGSFALHVPENGLIALNVPLDPLRLGALSTRTTHPYYIARWNELVRALGIPSRIENPYWDRTKGEMISHCGNLPLLSRLISQTLSCASPTKGRWQGYGIQHCGFCLPCLIRRAAIASGLGTPDPTTYTLSNMVERPLDSRHAEGQQVRSFQFAIERLRRKPALASILIHKPGPLSDESPIRLAALADVYRRGMGEVATLLASVRSEPS